MTIEHDLFDLEGRLKDLETGISCSVSGIVPGLLFQALNSIEQKHTTPKLLGNAFVGGAVSAITCGLGGYFIARYQRLSKRDQLSR